MSNVIDFKIFRRKKKLSECVTISVVIIFIKCINMLCSIIWLLKKEHENHKKNNWNIYLEVFLENGNYWDEFTNIICLQWFIITSVSQYLVPLVWQPKFFMECGLLKEHGGKVHGMFRTLAVENREQCERRERIEMGMKE